jgi:hypothetical protein
MGTGSVPTPKPSLEIRKNGEPTGLTGKPVQFFPSREPGGSRFC